MSFEEGYQMTKIAIVSALESILAKVAQTETTIKYSVPQPGDIVVGQVSEFTLKLVAYTNQLRREMALAETELEFETDEDTRRELAATARRVHSELEFVKAAYELQVRAELDDNWDARITLRDGGVAVITKSDKETADQAFAQLNESIDRKIEGGAGGQPKKASILDFLGIDIDDLPKEVADIAQLFGTGGIRVKRAA
jgi:hypothetical protein